VVIRSKKPILRRTFHCFIEYYLIAAKKRGGNVGALKNIMRMLLKCLMIVIILSAVGAFLAYIISQKTGREFYKVLEIIGIIIMLPGALSVLGNREIMASYKYNITLVIGDRSIVTNSIIILASMPAAAMTSIFAENFNFKKDYATVIMIVTTLFSILTIPVLLRVIV